MENKVIVSFKRDDENKLTATQKYDMLFARAYQALEEYDKANGTSYLKVNHEDKTFHYIDEYFAHLEHLYAIDKTFIMLPLDEAPFAINANTRTISAPKVVVMQNDQNAEVIMFTVDRYFDYKDLDTAFIYVQWTLPDGTEGASEIEMKDLSTPGKIRFGWVLDNQITSQKGNVKYSVRFWNLGKIKDEYGVEKDAVVYSLNTLTSTLTINESLQPQLNPEVSVNTPLADGFFKRAIINSQIYAENVGIPLVPNFQEPGLDLNAYESLTTVDGKDTLTLVAQAAAADNGELSYEWYYIPAEDYKKGDVTFYAGSEYPYNDKVEDDGTVIPGFSAYGGVVNNNVYEPVTIVNDKLEIGERYYVDENGTAYDGSLPRPKTLYERFTTYTVPENGADGTIVPVTGTYKVRVVSKMGVNTSRSQDSKSCQLVSPDEITFKKNGDLNTTEIFPVDENGNPLSTDLIVNVMDDDNLAAKRTYYWTRKSADKDALTPEQEWTLDGVDSNKLNITEPGWYAVEVRSTLNRETKTLQSEVCKVAYPTVAPQRVSDDPDIAATQILTMAYGETSNAKNKDDKGIPQYYASLGDQVVLDIVTTLNTPAGYDDKLFSENLSYVWGYQVPDGKFTELKESDVGDGKLVVEGLGTNTLKVRVLEDGKKYTYKCIVTNTVNNMAASCDQGTALAFAVE